MNGLCLLWVQKPTSHCLTMMSAFGREADIEWLGEQVRFGPQADIRQVSQPTPVAPHRSLR